MTVRSNRRQDGNLFHIVILFSLAVVWPLFEQIARSPEFFIIRRSGASDLILVIVTLVLILPGLWVFLTWLLKRWNYYFGRSIQEFALFLMFSSLILIPFNRNFKTSWLVSLSSCLTAACLLVIAYRRYSSIRTFIWFLAPGLLIIPGVFLASDSISKLIFNKKITLPQIEIASTTPIVLVVFDEFPLTSLLKDQQTINEELYPNFAALAKTTSWYRNATTVSDFTTYAVPAILTGRFPQTLNLPIVYDHPLNLFTALGQSYDLVVFEEGERLLPAEFDKLRNTTTHPLERLKSTLSDLMILYLHMVVPPEFRERLLPPVDQAWGSFAYDTRSVADQMSLRKLKFQAFFGSIKPILKPTLFYLHSMLPHAPWNYLPSGKDQQCGTGGVFRGYKRFMECHLLTVGYVDRLVGELIERLKKTGLYDRCLLIITADHGTTFRVGQARRAIGNSNFRDILLVPLFIKLPNQVDGEISDLNVWSIDVLPTVADVLDVQFGWVEGISVYDPLIKNRTSKRFFSGAKHEMFEFEALMHADPETLAAQEEIVRSPQFRLAAQQ